MDFALDEAFEMAISPKVGGLPGRTGPRATAVVVVWLICGQALAADDAPGVKKPDIKSWKVNSVTAHESFVAITTPDGLRVSTDGGESFVIINGKASRVRTGPGRFPSRRMATTFAGGRFYLYGARSLYVSDDLGETLIFHGQTPGQDSGALAAGGGKLMLLAGGTLFAIDPGALKPGSRADPTEVPVTAISGGHANTYEVTVSGERLALVGDERVILSEDLGRTHRVLDRKNWPEGLRGYQTKTARWLGDRLIIATGGGLMLSRDGGKTFEVRGAANGIANSPTQLVPSPPGFGLFVGTLRGVYFSRDGGDTFPQFFATERGVTALAAVGKRLYIGAGRELVVVEDFFASAAKTDVPAPCPEGTRRVIGKRAVSSWCELRGGKKHGPEASYSHDGTRISITEYRQGKRHGAFERIDDGDFAAIQGQYADDERHGTWRFSRQGILVADGAFVADRPSGPWRYRFERDGPMVQYPATIPLFSRVGVASAKAGVIEAFEVLDIDFRSGKLAYKATDSGREEADANCNYEAVVDCDYPGMELPGRRVRLGWSDLSGTKAGSLHTVYGHASQRRQCTPYAEARRELQAAKREIAAAGLNIAARPQPWKVAERTQTKRHRTWRFEHPGAASEGLAGSQTPVIVRYTGWRSEPRLHPVLAAAWPQHHGGLTIVPNAWLDVRRGSRLLFRDFTPDRSSITDVRLYSDGQRAVLVYGLSSFECCECGESQTTTAASPVIELGDPSAISAD